MKPTVLVTGGAGFIGSHLVDRLVGEGLTVRVLDNFSSGRIDNVRHRAGHVEVLNGDLKDSYMVLGAVKDVETVFHFAADPEVRVSTINPEICFNENVVATFNLLEAIRKADVKQLIFASSSSVYGEPETIPVDETAPTRPISVYGASKAACENLIHAYNHLYGIRAAALRYANVVGPRLRHGIIYDFIVKLMKNPNVLEVLGDGTQTRSYVYITDAIEATLTAWRQSANIFEVYNVGNEDWVNVNEIAEITVKVLGLKGVKRIYKPVLHGVGWLGDVKHIALSINKLKALGWSPKMKSREALAKTIQDILNELKETPKC